MSKETYKRDLQRGAYMSKETYKRDLQRGAYMSKETYKRDLQRGAYMSKETYKRDLQRGAYMSKETYKRDLQTRPTKDHTHTHTHTHTHRSVPISHKQIHDWEQGLQRQVNYYLPHMHKGNYFLPQNRSCTGRTASNVRSIIIYLIFF
jgi:hypothetical protein